MIDWGSFDWQAFATLAAGLAAVIGATILGLRQVAITERQADIAERQTKILGRQVELEELKLRSDLYVRRLAVYVATDNYIDSALKESISDLDLVLMSIKLRATVQASRFLFRSSVTQTLIDIDLTGGALRFAKRQLLSFDERHPRSDQNDTDARQAIIDDITRAERKLLLMTHDLPDVFGHELQLGSQAEPAMEAPSNARDCIRKI